MGLTLHYELAAAACPAAKARTLVEQLRKYALSLPFQSVSKVIELKQDACQFRRDNKGDPHAWLKVQTIRFQVEEEGDVIRSTNGAQAPPRLRTTNDPPLVHPWSGFDAADAVRGGVGGELLEGHLAAT